MRTLSRWGWALVFALSVGSIAQADPQSGALGAGDMFAPYVMRPLPAEVIRTYSGYDPVLAPIPFVDHLGKSAPYDPMSAPQNGGGTLLQYFTQFEMGTASTLYGTNQQAPALKANYRPYQLNGTVVYDNVTGRVLEYASVNESGNSYSYAQLFADGDKVYYQNNGMTTPVTIPLPYAASRPVGIEEFLVGIKLRGEFRGPAMESLLTRTSARYVDTGKLGRGADARALIYAISANDYDRSHGYDYLRIWVRVGDFKLLQTELVMPWGTETTRYQMTADGRTFPPEWFLAPGEDAGYGM